MGRYLDDPRMPRSTLIVGAYHAADSGVVAIVDGLTAARRAFALAWSIEPAASTVRKGKSSLLTGPRSNLRTEAGNLWSHAGEQLPQMAARRFGYMLSGKHGNPDVGEFTISASRALSQAPAGTSSDQCCERNREGHQL
jgi:hypothetical protein